MLQEPTCYKRKCRYYLGIIQPDGTELTERNNCEAFPEGIPDEISYGDNLHKEPLKNQKNDIIFQLERRGTK